MTEVIQSNCSDNQLERDIFNSLNLDTPRSFFLFAGAGSGKTRSLVNILIMIRKEYSSRLRMNRQQIAVITYTNAACNEIKRRLDNDSLFVITTIHSFVWELVKNYQNDIKEWLRIRISAEIEELKEQQLKGRSGTKTGIDRERKIQIYSTRLEKLDMIKRFTYNPNGDNISRESLNHSEVINIGSSFLLEKLSLQNIFIQKFPILLIDESQDTKKELIEAFFYIQKNNPNHFSLGLFGDTMQRIYSDGKDDLDQNLPEDWIKPVKKINYRCPKRVISLINKIRKEVDDQEQIAKPDKEEGTVRFYIVPSSQINKAVVENEIAKKMAQITCDPLWYGPDSSVKILTLEHHMAANRMGFIELFEPLYKIDHYRTGLLDGTLPGIRFFTQIILPLIKAKQNMDEFAVCRIIRQYSPLFSQENFRKIPSQIGIINQANEKVNSLISLWQKDTIPSLISILQNVAKSGLFSIPESLAPIAFRSKDEQKVANSNMSSAELDVNRDDLIDAWDTALSSSFIQIEAYNSYITDTAKLGTHQGVKGLQFPRVLLILDDEQARGFMFSYEKLFGAKAMSDTDKKNIQEGKETSIDRTRRLFYVTCSRAEKSLAIVAYTLNPNLVMNQILKDGWFQKEEIEIVKL